MDYLNLIDHTALKAFTQQKDIEKLCKEAIEYNFKSVCVNPTWVKYASETLKGKAIEICTVIGFPLGANTSEVKAFETKDCIKNGATEVDMVINIGAAKDGKWDLVESDIKAVVDAANGTLVKVIIETCYLTKEEIAEASRRTLAAGANFVKTSTGFGTGGSTPEDVKLMHESVDKKIEIKASGGVRTLEDLKNVVNAGATRIGASAGVAIAKGLKAETDY